MSANRPKLELSFRSFKLRAEEPEAINVMKWPVSILLVAVAISLLVVAFRVQPIIWAKSAAAWLASL